MIQETRARALPGLVTLPFLLLLVLGPLVMLVRLARAGADPLPIFTCVLLTLLGCLLSAGLTIGNPNDARVLTLFGRYVGGACASRACGA